MEDMNASVSKETLDLFLKYWTQQGFSYNVRKVARDDDTTTYESIDLPWYHEGHIAQSVKKDDGSFEHTIFIRLPRMEDLPHKKLKLVAGERPLPFMTKLEKREWEDAFAERIKPPLDSNRPPKL
jgi:hypothetical protein